MTSRQTAFLIAFFLAAIPVGIASYRARRWIWSQVAFAPVFIQAILAIALATVTLSLFIQGGERVREPASWAFLGVLVVAVVWGRLRYGQSPRRQRWDATWAEVGKLLPRDAEAADKLVTQGLEEDDRERETLRLQAANDPSAARTFLKETERELSELDASSKGRPDLAAVLVKRRARLEADRTWALGIVQRALPNKRLKLPPRVD